MTTTHKATAALLLAFLFLGCGGNVPKKKLFDTDEIASRAEVYRKTGNTEAAMRDLLRALALAEGTDNRLEVATVCNALATLCYSNNDFPSAVKHLQRAEKIARKENVPELLATTLGNRGCVQTAMGELDVARASYEEALALDEKTKDRQGKACHLNNLALLYRRWGKTDKALGLLSEALSINRAIKNDAGIACNLCNIASIHEAKGDPDKAIALYQEAVEIDKQVENFDGVATCLSNMAYLYEGMGKVDLAIDYYRRAGNVNALISRDDRANQDYENAERLRVKHQREK